jgi:hypothetical protein
LGFGSGIAINLYRIAVGIYGFKMQLIVDLSNGNLHISISF